MLFSLIIVAGAATGLIVGAAKRGYFSGRVVENNSNFGLLGYTLLGILGSIIVGTLIYIVILAQAFSGG